jgi:hypothetical protein
LDDYESLRLHLWAFISTLPARSQFPRPQPASQPTDFDATAILSRLDSISSQGRSAYLQTEQLVADLLRQVGAEVFENPDRSGHDHPVDLAFLPSRESGEVVVAELKVGHLDETRLSRAEEQLQAYVGARHASIGLVLYHDFQGRHFPSHRANPPVIRLSVRELIAGLVTNSLPQLISLVVDDATKWFV